MSRLLAVADVEGQRGDDGLRSGRDDAKAFDAGDHQRKRDKVRQQRRQHQCGERYLRDHLFGGKAEREVSDQHCGSP